jgi:flagellar basal-body rod protein FlgB
VNLFSETLAILERSLNLRSRQHRVLSSNIANMDTPNYKAFELVVEEEMAKSKGSPNNLKLTRSNLNHLPADSRPLDKVKLKLADPPEFSLRGDGNTVDIDKTMGDLAENTLLYKTAAQIISKKFQGLKLAIRGGK